MPSGQFPSGQFPSGRIPSGQAPQAQVPSGQVYVDVPFAPPGAMACTNPAPPGPADILRGEPGNVLGGPPSPDLLRGPGQAVVEIAPN